MRNALIARHSNFEIDSRCPFYSQFHRMNPNVLMFMPDVRIKRLWCVNPAFTPRISRSPGPLALRHKENLVRVRILHFSAGRESFHIDIFARRIRALHQMRFAGDRDSVWIISLCHLCRRRGRGRRRRCDHRRRCSRWLNWSVRVKRLLRRWVFLRLGRRVSRRPVALRRWRRRLLSA